MAKPANAKQCDLDLDLTYIALQEASHYLPASKWYRLVVHPQMIRYANKVVGLHADVLGSNPLSPGIEISVDETLTNINEWRLEAGGEVFWSPGA